MLQSDSLKMVTRSETVPGEKPPFIQLLNLCNDFTLGFA